MRERYEHVYAYGVALVGVVVTAAFRYALDSVMGDTSQAMPFVIPVVLAAWYGGLYPGLLATALGTAAAAGFFGRPADGIPIGPTGEAISLSLFAASGALVSWVCESVHIARRTAERERERVQLVADAVPALISYIDADARYQLNNRAYERWFGHPRGEMLGRHMREVLGDPAWAALRDKVQRALAGEVVTYQAEAPYREGGTRWIDATYTPDQDADGTVRGIVAHVNDITPLIAAQRQLRENEERLRSLMDNTPLAVVEWDAAFVVTRWTGQAEKLFGWTAAEIVGRSLSQRPWVYPEDQAAVDDAVQRLLDPATRFVVSRNRNYSKAGEVLSIEWYHSVLHDESGRIIAVQSLGLDITERERTAEQLRRRVEEVQTLMEFLPIAVIRADDAECRRVTGNPAAYRLLRVPPGDNLSKTAPSQELPRSYRTFQHGVEIPPEQLPMQVACRTGHEVRGAEYDIVYEDGGASRIYCYATPLFDGQRTVRGCLFAALDITARYEAERQLLAAEERFRASQEASLIGLTILKSVRDGEGRIVDFEWEYVNPTAAALLKRPSETLIGRRLLEVLPANRGDSGLFDTYVHVVDTGEPRDYEVEYTADGIGGWFRNMTVKLGDGVAVSFMDVTDRHRREDALRDADRRKDEFLATLAHELRSPLAPIRNAVQVLRLRGPAEPELMWSRDIIERQVAQMARLLDDLLDVNRITRGKLQLQKERVSIGSILDIALETSRPAIMAGRHELSVRTPADMVLVEGDSVRLAQVFSNLLNNAAKYTEPGGHIEVVAEAAGSEVTVTVEDSGIGIAADVLPRIFDMFAQATPALERSQGGLGIGLSLARGLVEMHGGSIVAHSNGPGAGARFSVTLPASVPHPDPAAPPAKADAPGGPRLRILVADDNSDSVETMALLLEFMGHEVRTAGDGEAAVQAAEVFRPAVVLLDIGMPRMNGYEAARAIRREPWGQGMFLIAVTGWGQEEDRQRAADAGFDRHFVKPIAPEAIADVLARMAEPAE